VIGGRVLFLGFEGKALTREERRLLARLKPAGVVLFTRNLGDAGEVDELVGNLRALLPGCLLAIDAEGGRVDRLKGIAGPSPAAAELALQPPPAALRAGRRMGALLRRFYFDLDFAPVVDLDYGLSGNALDRRTFGRTSRAVVARASAFARGLHREGVGSCIKHFPGLGAAPVDTHFGVARIELPRVNLAVALSPFTALFSLASSVMVSHAIYPGWGENELPASLSRTICNDLLRKQLGYRGSLVSDDLEMGALAEIGDLPAIGARALEAGCDGLLFCRRLDEAPGIATALARPKLRGRLDDAAKRVERLRRNLSVLRRSAGRKAAPAPR
jgi:beta-N-acetylhexosaminidase